MRECNTNRLAAPAGRSVLVRIDFPAEASSRSRRTHTMNRICFLGLVAVLALWPGAVHAGPSDADLQDIIGSVGGVPEQTPVRARLIAESRTVPAGGKVWLGIHLDQDPGWHTYWRNPGDAGLATEVQWELPEGFTVSGLVWPTPHRYVEAGDLTTFGYDGHVVLMAELTAPAGAQGSFTVGAQVSWLMCKALCIPGEDTLSLALQVGPAQAPASTADQALFAEARARWAQDAAPGLGVRTAMELSPLPAGQNAHAALAIDGLTDAATTGWTWFPEYREGLFSGTASGRVEAGRLLIALPLSVEGSVPAGTQLDWGGVLELEPAAADPVFLRVPLPVTVAAAGQRLSADASGLVAAALGAQADPPRAAPTGNLFYYLLLALVGGVILNVMPCVLPVLSLKVMSFVHHAGEDRGVQFRLGLMFTGGVLASFLALAVVVIGLQAAGELVGWGFQFQNPAFVVVMAAVVFAFGLSLFGVYEVILPVQIGGGGGRNGAYAESFLNGVLATALATPCTAPLLGSALGFAFSQPATVILAIFLTTGLGLSLPYLILSMNPSWLRFVPRPGAWMDRFKQLMGFLLMATLIWLLWVLGQQVGLDALARVMAFLLLLGFALWLYGSLLNLSSSRGRRFGVWALVIALIAVGWVQLVRNQVGAAAVAAHAETGGAMAATAFTEERLAAEVSGGNTVFIDFTAAWCMTCKVNEKTVIDTDEVQAVLAELGVVTLVGDWTNRDEAITRVLREHGRGGVPFYAVFPAGRLDDPIVLPEVITRSLVIDALRKAGPSAAVASR